MHGSSWVWSAGEQRPDEAMARAQAAVSRLESEGSEEAQAAAFAEVTELSSWAECRLAVDGSDDLARQALPTIDALVARTEALRSGAHQPSLASRLDAAGHRSWSRLYRALATSITVEHDGEQRGLATAARELQHADRGRRSAAFHAIDRAWTPHRVTLAAAMSALVEWRRVTEGDVLGAALSRFRMRPETLEALLGALDDRRSIGHRALRAVAHSRGWASFAPWDLSAPPPAIAPLSLERGFEIIERAFDSFDVRMGDYFRELRREERIDCASGPRRRNGAFALPFPVQRFARVFVQWTGTLADVRILGHELGHAFHYGLIRDRSALEIDIPHSLVETPSAFAELAVAAELARSPDGQLVRAAAAQDLLFAVSMIAVMPARFEVERAVVSLGHPASADELDALTAAQARRWLGSALEPIDGRAWMRTHHYFTADARFAHITYTIGYLLALGLHRLRASYDQVTGFIGDLARASVEECAERHLGTRLEDGALIHHALDEIEERVDRLTDPQLSRY